MVAGRHRAGDATGASPSSQSIPLVSGLLAAQNADGGWPYRRGTSWTEPTALALLALEGRQEAAVQYARGVEWLAARQRPDGGWAPQPGVEQSTWVTSLVALLPPARIGQARHARAIAWLLGQTGKETTFWYRLRQRLQGVPINNPVSGWPWFPGTAAWVTPTSLAILALRKAARESQGDELQARIESGCAYLLAHRCSDGGWNHGSSRALGYESNSYPETTGIALLALEGVPKLDGSLSTAERQLRDCRSAEGVSWLHMGLLAHGRKAAGVAPPCVVRNIRDEALAALAERAEQGRNVFRA